MWPYSLSAKYPGSRQPFVFSLATLGLHGVHGIHGLTQDTGYRARHFCAGLPVQTWLLCAKFSIFTPRLASALGIFETERVGPKDFDLLIRMSNGQQEPEL